MVRKYYARTPSISGRGSSPVVTAKISRFDRDRLTKVLGGQTVSEFVREAVVAMINLRMEILEELQPPDATVQSKFIEIGKAQPGWLESMMLTGEITIEAQTAQAIEAASSIGVNGKATRCGSVRFVDHRHTIPHVGDAVVDLPDGSTVILRKKRLES